MRLLCVGFPLPNAAIDNYNVFTAPSFFDYDALLVDPLNITHTAARLVDHSEAYEAFDGRPVVNGSSTAAAVSAAELIRRRSAEAERFLEAGGTVLVVARPNAVQAGIIGFEGCDRYHWLPAPAGVSWSLPQLRPAEGKTVRIVDNDHPLAGVLRSFRNEVAYRAIFDERDPALRKASRVIATGGAGAPIAVEFPVLAGRVVFMPALSTYEMQYRADFAQALIDVLAQLVAESGREDPPYYAASLDLPGLGEMMGELEQAEAEARAAVDQRDAIRARYDDLTRHRRLVSAGGRAFTGAVVDALRLLGFSVTSAAGEPLVVEAEGAVAFVETESDRAQVVEWPYVRLQRRLEEHLLKEGEQRKGIVIVNGHRTVEPASREPQYTGALGIACENYRYALVTGETLLATVRAVLAGADDAAIAGMRRRLLAATGALDPQAALGEAAPPKDAEPIF